MEETFGEIEMLMTPEERLLLLEAQAEWAGALAAEQHARARAEYPDSDPEVRRAENKVAAARARYFAILEPIQEESRRVKRLNRTGLFCIGLGGRLQMEQAADFSGLRSQRLIE